MCTKYWFDTKFFISLYASCSHSIYSLSVLSLDSFSHTLHRQSLFLPHTESVSTLSLLPEMSCSDSSDTDFSNGDSPAPTNASTETTLTAPLQQTQPAYTIVNTPEALKACLDDILRETAIPPKLYSQSHSPRPTNRPSGSTQTQPISLSEPTSITPPLFHLPKSTPEIYLDAEGISLSRSGELSILILHIETATLSKTYLIHVHLLGRRTFFTKTTNGRHTLKSLLEDNRLPKVLFDCRMDSDALFGQFGVLIGDVIDLQLMCLATQNGGPKHLPSLGKCLSTDLRMTMEEHHRIDSAKARGQRIWQPKCGGSMQRFNDNQLHPDIIDYCIVDAAYLPTLFATYNAALGNQVSLGRLDHLWPKVGCSADEKEALNWVAKILDESRRRVLRALEPNFRGGTAHNFWWNPHDEYDNSGWNDY